MILDSIATVLITILVVRQGFSALEVWGGPYPEKGKYVLISGGILIAAALTLLAVWL